MARYARLYALFLLNQLYTHIGIASRAKKYRDGFALLNAEFDRRIGRGYSDQVKNSGVVKDLRRALIAFESGSVSQLEALQPSEGWVEKFIAFARFLHSVQRFAVEFGVQPATGRIFLSHQHDDATAELLRSQLQAIAKEPGLPPLRILLFRDPGGGKLSWIKHLIWLADGIKAVIPRSPASLATGAPKNYKWIAREAEHGLFLGKRVLFLLEDGVDIDAVATEFRTIADSLLSPRTSASAPERIDRLVDHLKATVGTPFRILEVSDTADMLDPRVRRLVVDEAQAIADNRCVDLLSGFLLQFSEEQRRTLLRVHAVVPKPVSKPRKWIVAEIARKFPDNGGPRRAERAFENLWRSTRERQLELAGQRFGLIGISGGRYYTSRIVDIVEAIRPGLGPIRAQELARRILYESVEAEYI